MIYAVSPVILANVAHAAEVASKPIATNVKQIGIVVKDLDKSN